MIRKTIAAICLIIASTVQAQPITVFAAASLADALTEIAEQFEAESGEEVVFAFAGSSLLARQIEHGAPADVFVSANVDWMDHLQRKGLVRQSSRVNLTGNRLVVVATSSDAATLDLQRADELQHRLGDGYLAMALVEAVPAGIYGREALLSLGLWSSVRGRVAQADNVRAALALVASGEAPLGVVYRSDVSADGMATLRIVADIPTHAHQPIVYPAAVVTSSRHEKSQLLLDRLRSEAAQRVFAKHGFTVLGR